MATRVLPEFPPPCPHCGRRMAVIEVEVPTPPLVVQLIGCENCGITSNELPPAETEAGDAVRDDYRRK